MSAVDEIQTAIDRLTAMQTAAGVSYLTTINEECSWYAVELATALHRTIDAQLAILKSALGHFPDQFMQVQDQREWLNKRPSTRNALALARAINGGTR